MQNPAPFDLPEVGWMPCRRLLWMPIGEARLKSSTFLHGQSARKKVTYEVRHAVRSGKTATLSLRLKFGFQFCHERVSLARDSLHKLVLLLLVSAQCSQFCDALV